MILYIVIQNSNSIINDNFYGLNSFDYDKENYIHFFLLPENAEIYQILRYKNNDIPSEIIKCDIPYFKIKNNFGIGMYKYYHPKYKSPFLKCIIPLEQFDKSMILEKEKKVPASWKNSEIYKRYLIECVYLHRCLLHNDSENKIRLNREFNFLHYFPRSVLKKEKIECTDYPIDNSIDEQYMMDPYYKALLGIKVNEDSKVFLERCKQKLNALKNLSNPRRK